MTVRTRYSPNHQNSGGVYKGTPNLDAAIRATPVERGGGRTGLERAIAATPRRYGGGKRLLDEAIEATERQRYPAPKAAPAIPLPGASKYRVTAPVLKHILRSGNPLSLYRGLLGDLAGSMANAWAGRAGAGAFVLDTPPGAGGSCYSYQFLGGPQGSCSGGYGAQMAIYTNWGSFNPDCDTWHYALQVPNYMGMPNVDLDGYRGVRILFGPLVGGIFGCQRFNIEHVWKREWPVDEPAPVGRAIVRPRVGPVPSSVPEPAPFSDPALDGLPRPYGRPRYRPDRDVRPARASRKKPYITPAVSYSPAPGGAGLRKGPPEDHYETPPAKGRDKKRKWPLGLIDRFYGPFTEGLDYLEAIEDSIGDRRCKGGGRTLQERLNCVRRNWRHVDPYDLAYNLAMNELQDRAIGKLGQLHKRATGHAADKGYWRSVRGPSISRFPGYIR